MTLFSAISQLRAAVVSYGCYGIDSAISSRLTWLAVGALTTYLPAVFWREALQELKVSRLNAREPSLELEVVNKNKDEWKGIDYCSREDRKKCTLPHFKHVEDYYHQGADKSDRRDPPFFVDKLQHLFPSPWLVLFPVGYATVLATLATAGGRTPLTGSVLKYVGAQAAVKMFDIMVIMDCVWKRPDKSAAFPGLDKMKNWPQLHSSPRLCFAALYFGARLVDSFFAASMPANTLPFASLRALTWQTLQQTTNEIFNSRKVALAAAAVFTIGYAVVHRRELEHHSRIDDADFIEVTEGDLGEFTSSEVDDECTSNDCPKWYIEGADGHRFHKIKRYGVRVEPATARRIYPGLNTVLIPLAYGAVLTAIATAGGRVRLTAGAAASVAARTAMVVVDLAVINTCVWKGGLPRAKHVAETLSEIKLHSNKRLAFAALYFALRFADGLFTNATSPIPFVSSGSALLQKAMLLAKR